MTKEEAWKIIDECRNWNYGQKSIGYAFGGHRSAEDDVFDARRAALLEAWKTVGTEKESKS